MEAVDGYRRGERRPLTLDEFAGLAWRRQTACWPLTFPDRLLEVWKVNGGTFDEWMAINAINADPAEAERFMADVMPAVVAELRAVAALPVVDFGAGDPRCAAVLLALLRRLHRQSAGLPRYDPPPVSAPEHVPASA